jgi:DNA-binding response OmpR family regulator
VGRLQGESLDYSGITVKQAGAYRSVADAKTLVSKTENVIAARKAGVNNYIVKPFNAQTLKTKIESVLADAG